MGESFKYRSIGHNIFNLGSGKKTGVKELIEEIQKNIKLINVSVSDETPGDQRAYFQIILI